MRRHFKIFISSFLIIIFAAGNIMAAALTTQEILAKMQAQEATLQDLQFDLRQEIRFKELKERQTVLAKVIYKKPDLLYVEYKAPNEQLVLANKDNMIMYAKEKGQWQETMHQKISNLVGKQWKADYGVWTTTDLEKNYEVKSAVQGANTVVLKLAPKEKTYNFTMSIVINTKNWLPVKTLWEDDNQVITTNLQNIKVNTGVSDELFKFK